MPAQQIKHESLGHALLAAQAEFPPIERTSRVDAGKFGYSYATLPKVREACDPILNRNGLIVYHTTKVENGSLLLSTVLEHPDSKETRESVWDITDSTGDPKKIGANMTYGERYTYCALLGIAAEDDNDAQRTSSRGSSKKQPPKKSPPKKQPPSESESSGGNGDKDFDQATFLKIYRDKIDGVFESEEERLAFNQLHTGKEHTKDFAIEEWNKLWTPLAKYIAVAKKEAKAS